MRETAAYRQHHLDPRRCAPRRCGWPTGLQGGACAPDQADGGRTRVPHGIRVNAVAPGPVDTDMALKVHSKGNPRRLSRRHSFNRYGPPEEQADAILYLCGPNSTYITGQVLAVDGGSTPPASACRRCVATWATGEAVVPTRGDQICLAVQPTMARMASASVCRAPLPSLFAVVGASKPSS